MTTLSVKASTKFSGVSKDLTAASNGEGLFTLKHKQGDVTASLEFTDKTAQDLAALQGPVRALVEYRINSDLQVHAGYDLSVKSYRVGAEYSGEVADRKVSLKAHYAEADKTVDGEASLAIDSDNKATLTFSNADVTSVKYSYTNGDYTLEPQYCLRKQAPTLAVSKKEGKATYKASYNVKTEKATVEWNQKPWKVAAAATAGAKGLGKPTVTATWEKTYSF